MADWRAGAAALLLMAALAGCGTDGPDATDRLRIAAMRDDPIFQYRIEPGQPDPGWAGAVLVPDTYSAVIPLWAGDNPPARPTGDQTRQALEAFIDRLFASRWTIVSARCSEHPQWELFAYRVRDGVAYTLRATGMFNTEPTAEPELTVRLVLSAQYHTDHTRYFNPLPAGIQGPTCLETVDPWPGEDEGTIWSLRDGAAR